MAYVNITALSFPPGAQAEIERRFGARQKAGGAPAGFPGFALPRPPVRHDPYFAVTRRDSQQDYQAWSSARPTGGHDDDKRRGMSVEILGFEVVDLDD